MVLQGAQRDFVTENKSEYRSRIVLIAKSVVALLIFYCVGYFFLDEFRKSRIFLDNFEINFSFSYLIIAFILCFFSYIADVVIWRLFICEQVDCENITYKEIFSVIFSTNFLKYIPGRVWTVAAQAILLKKYNIKKLYILYINFLCMFELLLFSLYCLLIYVFIYTDMIFVNVFYVLFFSIVLVNILYNVHCTFFSNKIISFVGRIAKIEMGIITVSARIMIVIQAVFLVSWLLVGLASLSLAKGIGLQVVLADFFPVVASMASSWLAGYMVFFAPGGLGIREGMMLLMLKPAVDVPMALLLPIVTRVLFLLVEAFLGLTAMCLGGRKGVFILDKGGVTSGEQ